MPEKKYLVERIYRIRQQSGGLELSLKWPLPEGRSGTPAFLSLSLMGYASGKLRSVRVDIPGNRIPTLLTLKNLPPADTDVFRCQGSTGKEQLWFFNLSFLGEELRKPWEFRIQLAEGENDLLLTEPISFRVSQSTLQNLLKTLEQHALPR